MAVRDAPRCFLAPIDLHDPAQAALLLRQRVQCGWAKDPADIARWRAMADAGTKSLFWIVPGDAPDDAPPAAAAAPRPADAYRGAVGHIGLQSVDDAEADSGPASAGSAEDPPLALRDKSVLTLSSFFVEPAHRGGGLGGAAMRQAEALARVPPHGSPACRAIMIQTISRRYTEDDGPEWRGSFAARGREPPPRGSSNEDWYARMGYVKYREEPRYRDVLLDGTEIWLLGVLMQKTL